MANEKANAVSVNDVTRTENEARANQERQAKGKPANELIETWLTLSNSGLGASKIELMPESGGFKQTTIKKYLRQAREAAKGESKGESKGE